MILVLLGPPGSGKGTQAKKLWADRHWPQLSTGDMLRTSIQAGTKLGTEAKFHMDQGHLVPDDVVVGLIAERSELADCKNGFVLDGFPRNISQAEVLDKMLKSQGRSVDRVILFDIPDEAIVQRLSGRRICSQCGAMYHLDSAPPQKASHCDQCNNPLIQRDDDRSDIVRKRLLVYHQQTEPLVGFYNKQKKLKKLDAVLSAIDVGQVLSEALI